MKLINGKGKLFGLINVVDLLVLVMIVFMAGVVYVKIKGESVTTGSFDKVNYEITLRSKSALQNTVDNFEIGALVLENDKNQVLGELVSKEIKPATKEVTTADGEILLANVPGRIDVYAVVKGNGILDSKKGLIVGPNDWQIGNSLVFKTNKSVFQGHIVDIEIKDGE